MSLEKSKTGIHKSSAAARRAARCGLTMIELLIVVFIIAVLAVIVTVIINPSALLQQSRDSNRPALGQRDRHSSHWDSQGSRGGLNLDVHYYISAATSAASCPSSTSGTAASGATRTSAA
jgi:prepilin-type N-terminal cleavage/methylation domain-containing protein